jgi:SAM-dependent methyltransferase
MLLNEQISSSVEGTGAEFLTLRCPRCHERLGALEREADLPICHRCGVELPCERGVWRALLPERAAYFARFRQDYECVRAHEGRGSAEAGYYLALPDRDTSGKLRGQWAVRARTFHHLERKILPHLASRKDARLRILDLGAGNCWMSYRLAQRGHLPVAVDLLTNPQDGLEAARHYASQLPGLFPRFQAELSNLPFEDRQFDVAIFNASFHYSESYETTLGEALRCVRPGGTVLVADTAWYRHETEGKRMLAERRAMFLKRYGFASEELCSQEFLTGERLDRLAGRFGITWQEFRPYYGLRWLLRPWLAKLLRRRTPSQFRIFAARVAG